MAASILFFLSKNGAQANFFKLFTKVFQRFRHRGNDFGDAKTLQILVGTGAIRLIQKLSELRYPRDFLAIRNFKKSLPGYRVHLNLQGGYKKETAI